MQIEKIKTALAAGLLIRSEACMGKGKSVTNRTVLFLALFISFLFSCSAKSSEEGSSAAKVESFHAELFLLEKNSIVRYYTASAILEGREEAIITSSIAGVIKKFYVREGAEVKEGERMLLIDPEDYQLEAKKAGAMAKVKRQNFKRIKKLFKKGAVSSSEYELAETDLEISNATHSQTKLNLSRTTVRTPIAGQVVSRSCVVGQRVTPGMTLFKIVNINDVEMTVALSEKEIIHLKSGDTVDVHVDAWADETFVGHIESVRVSSDSAIASFPVDIRVANDRRLKPGMVARAVMRGEVLSDLLLVPSESFTEKGGSQYVFVFKDGVARQRMVSRGRRFGEYVEVVSGLEVGEEIIPIYGSDLTDGTPVTPANRVKWGETDQTLKNRVDDIQETDEAFDG